MAVTRRAQASGVAKQPFSCNRLHATMTVPGDRAEAPPVRGDGKRVFV